MVAIKNTNEVKVFPDLKDLYLSLAVDFIGRANTAISTKGEFSVVLPGGNTPRLFFDILVDITIYKRKIAWDKIKFFFGDERYVPSDNIESNYRMAYEHLFSKVPVLPENIYRILTAFKNPNDAAKDYELTIRTECHTQDNEFPHFDIVYLGLGEDAHTASLMPFSEVVTRYCTQTVIPNYQLVDALWAPQHNMHRITLTPPVINNAASIVFMATGFNKASAVYRAIEAPVNPQQYPAQLIHCINSKNVWYLDEAAASQLEIKRDDI